MPMPMPTELNKFKELAEDAWACGEDGEMIAKELGAAFAWVVLEGLGAEADIYAEFKRLVPPGVTRHSGK